MQGMQKREGVRVRCVWTIKESRPGGIYVPVLTRSNIFTDNGLTLLAGALGGSYTPPTYLAVDTLAGTIQDANGLAVGATSVSLDKAVDQPGDQQLVLGAGTATEEAVSFSARSGAGPYVYTISATTKSHNQGDVCSRQVLHNDTIANLTAEGQYDSVAAANQRMQSIGGYSQGIGNWTQQFFFTGQQALFTFATAGLADSAALGSGTLHDHLVLGYVHNSGTDVEIDVSLTLANNG